MDYFTLIMLGLGGFLVYKKFIKKTENIAEPTTNATIEQSYDTIMQQNTTTQEASAASTTNLTIAKDYILIPKAWDTLYLSYDSLVQQSTGNYKNTGNLTINSLFNYKKYASPKKVEFAKDKTYNVVAEAIVKLNPGTKYKVYATEGLLQTDALALNKGYLKVYFFKVQAGKPYPEPVLQYWSKWGKITLDKDLNPFTIVPSLEIIPVSSRNNIQKYVFYDYHTMVNILPATAYNPAFVDLNPKVSIQTTGSEKEQTALVKQTTQTTNKTNTFIRS